MSKNYRYVITALAGLAALLIAFGLGAMWREASFEETRAPIYRFASDQARDIDLTSSEQPNPKSLEYREPCRNPKGSGESDLCAQWRAAYAGENSAYWAKWGFWTGLAGIGGLLASLYYTRKAVLAAEDASKDTATALKIARDSVGTERAWLVFTGFESGFNINGFYGGVQIRRSIVFIPKWLNSGRSPAVQHVMYTNFVVSSFDATVPEFNNVEAGGPDQQGQSIGQSISFNGMVVALDDTETPAFERRELKVYVYSRCNYRDVYANVDRVSEVCVEIKSAGGTRQENGREVPAYEIRPVGPQNRIT